MKCCGETVRVSAWAGGYTRSFARGLIEGAELYLRAQGHVPSQHAKQVYALAPGKDYDDKNGLAPGAHEKDDFEFEFNEAYRKLGTPPPPHPEKTVPESRLQTAEEGEAMTVVRECNSKPTS